MTNIEKYEDTFINSFQVNKHELSALSYQGVDTWDSVGHMKMIAELEEAFNVMLETDDILDLSSYIKGIKILEKYGVQF